MNSKEPYTFDEWMSEKNDEEIDLLTFSDVWNAAIESARRVCEREFHSLSFISDEYEHEIGAYFCMDEVKALIQK